MAYTKTQWNPGGAPGISAQNLNKIEQGISDAHDIAEDAKTQIEEHKNDYKTHQGVPTGAILMWSGSADNIPDGWGLCDGSTYERLDGKGIITAPDLRDRFIVGAGNEYDVGDIGGEKSVILTESQMPEHRHDKGSLSTTLEGEHNHDGGGYTRTNGEHRHTYDSIVSSSGLIQTGEGYGIGLKTEFTSYASGHNHRFYIKSDGEHSHNITGATSYVGNSEAHENRPPYYALCFIIKL